MTDVPFGAPRGPTREQMWMASTADRDQLLCNASTSTGSPVGHPNPALHLSWDEAAITAARGAPGGAPFTDSQGQHDPRTIQSLEQALQTAGGQRIAEGLFTFDTGDQLHQAIVVMFQRHPWVRHRDPSHAAQGDVARCCVRMNWIGKRNARIAFERLVYFNI